MVQMQVPFASSPRFAITSNKVGGVKYVFPMFSLCTGTRMRVRRSHAFGAVFLFHQSSLVCPSVLLGSFHFICSVLPGKDLFGHSGQDELFDLLLGGGARAAAIAIKLAPVIAQPSRMRTTLLLPHRPAAAELCIADLISQHDVKPYAQLACGRYLCLSQALL
jgi:hypothetical protein